MVNNFKFLLHKNVSKIIAANDLSKGIIKSKAFIIRKSDLCCLKNSLIIKKHILFAG